MTIYSLYITKEIIARLLNDLNIQKEIYLILNQNQRNNT